MSLPDFEASRSAGIAVQQIWTTLKEWLLATWCYLQAFADWTEEHPGLGTWVGAAGAVIAILAAWGLARAEYNRVERMEAERFNSEIALINGLRQNLFR